MQKAEWWGASLSILVAAIHHPGVLAKLLLGNHPAQVGRWQAVRGPWSPSH